MHVSQDPLVMERRQSEFDGARTAYEVAELHKRWQQEDIVLASMADARHCELAELRGRVAVLERVVGPGAKAIIDPMMEAIVDILGRVLHKERQLIFAELEAKGLLCYAGTYDDAAAYQRGALVSHAGSGWIAIAPISKGSRPGKSADWRLAIKGQVKDPGYA